MFWTSFFLKFRKLSNLLSVSVNLRIIPHSKAINPTHFLRARYPHPKSLLSGKGLTFALSGSISGVSHLRNLYKIIYGFSRKIFQTDYAS